MLMRKSSGVKMIGAGLLLMLMITVPLKAQDPVKFEPYASIRMFASYDSQSKEITGTDTDTDLTMGLEPTSRIGADFTVSEKLSAKTELSLKDTISLRHAYITYKINNITIRVGQDWTPVTYGSSEMADGENGCAGFGSTDDGRKKQARVTIAGAYLCLMEPVLTPDIGSFDVDTIDSVIPEVVIGYDYSSDMIKAGLGFAYQTYTLDDGTNTSVDGESIDTMIGFVHGTIDTEMIGVKFNFGIGKNFGNFGVDSGRMDTKAQLDGTDSIADTTCMEGYVEVCIKLGGPVVKIGSGYAQAENDTWAETDSQWLVYANMDLPIDTGFKFTPEFSYRDYLKDENDADEGTEWFAGIRFQADFK